MFLISSSGLGYSRAGLALMLAQFWLFAFALPPFQAGIWVQTEPLLAVLFFFTCLDALWLAVGVLKKWLLPQAPNALEIVLLLWTGWQLLITLGASNSWRSWFGPAASGEGCGWYVALLLQYYMVSALWKMETCKRGLLLGSAGALMAQCLLHAFNPTDSEGLYIAGSWAPAQWAAYLVFMAVPVWMAFSLSDTMRNGRRYVAAVACFIVVLVVSHNKSAMAIFPLALFAAGVVFLPPRLARMQRCFSPSNKWRSAALLACLLPLAWIGFSAVYPAFNTSESGGFLHHVITQKDGPISSRLAYNQVGITALQHEPLRWVIGDGWGRYADDLFKYVLIDGVEVFHDGRRQPNWFMVDGSAFHSHDEPLEVLLSLGLPGMLLWFALPMVTIMLVPARHFWACAPMLVAQIILSALWFAVPQCVPYQALMWAALGSVMPASRKVWHIPEVACGGIFACVAALMAWSASEQWEAIRYGERLHQVIESKAYSEYPLAWVEQDIKRGGERLRNSAQGFARTLMGKTSVEEGARNWYVQYMQALHDASLSPRIGAFVASTEVQLQYKLLIFIPDPSLAELGHDTLLALPDSLVWLATLAPLRDDMATIYLMNLADATRGDIGEQQEILSRFLKQAPNHRAALWLRGKLLASTAGREKEAQELMRGAALLGVDRVYPVRYKELAAALLQEAH